MYQGGVFTTLDVPNASNTQATGINDIGQVVGLYGDAAGLHGFVDTGGVFTTIDSRTGGPVSTSAWGINNNGQVVGLFGPGVSTCGLIGFLDTGGVCTTIDYRTGRNPGT